MTVQEPLFGPLEPRPRHPGEVSSAVLSDDEVYRYVLSRAWDESRPVMVFVMLNPSTADATQDDRTINRCRDFAKRWGAGELRVVNLYAFRATKPEDMFAAQQRGVDIVGPDNDQHIREAVATAASFGGPVVAAWGVNALPMRVAHVKELLSLAGGRRVRCLGLTKDGHPRHPLYVKGDTELVTFR